MSIDVTIGGIISRSLAHSKSNQSLVIEVDVLNDTLIDGNDTFDIWISNVHRQVAIAM